MEAVKGLNKREVEESAKLHGKNIFTKKKPESFWQKYWKTFDDPIITILLIALGINVVFTFLGRVDWFECAGIFISVLLATFVSTLSEFKNEATFRKIQDEASQIMCKVYRENNLVELSADELVVGDFVLLQAGDLIPADGVVETGNVRVEQSVLNGESKEIEKTASKKHAEYRTRTIDFWDNHSLFRGAVVCFGQCVMRITEIGDKTIYGRLNREAQTEDRKSPLQVKLSALASTISRLGYVGAVLVVLICMFQKIVIDNSFNMIMIGQYFLDFAQVFSDFINALIVGIIVIVVAVPEGLPLMIAIVCSLNMKKMMKNNVLVRKLIGIETAGSINILFTDKTGTITCGKLKVVKYIDGKGEEYETFTGIPLALKQLLHASITGNSESHMSKGKVLGGNATDKALTEFVSADELDFKPLKLQKHEEILFSSSRKFSMAHVSGDICGMLIKGAPEKILPNCTKCYDSNGNVKPLTTAHSLKIATDSMAERSVRVIAVAVADSFNGDAVPQGMTLVGLLGIRDELRPDVKAAVREVHRAGIQVVMITGDKRETAVSIAREAGIINSSSDIVLTSEDLASMCDDEIAAILKEIRVIARALPTDKSRLVRIAQECGLVTGMTGDGINDLSALKRSDVGFAMGSGCDVAKEAGDIVILDDNFTSVKSAVLYGRTIYNSIKKFITFQLTINLAAVSVSILGPIFGTQKPLTITQMLWLNLCMDTLAAIAFGGEPALKKYMFCEPKRRDENIIDRRMLSAVIVNGLFICAMSLLMFVSDDIHYSFRSHGDDLYFYTGYFGFFIFSCIFNAFNVRCEGIDLTENISLNKPFLGIMLLISIVQIAMTYFGGTVLRTAGLIPTEWVVALVPAILIVPVDIFRKILLDRRRK